MGGEAKLSAIKAVKAKLTLTQKTPQGDFPMQMETVVVLSRSSARGNANSRWNHEIVVTPDAAFMAMPGQGMRDFPASQKAETLEQIKRDPIFIAAHCERSQRVFPRRGNREGRRHRSPHRRCNAAGTAIRWFVDPQSGHILKRLTEPSARASLQGETDMDDWKPVNGLNVPFVRRNKQNGQDSSTAEYTALEFNPAVDPKLFEKPAEKPPAQP